MSTARERLIACVRARRILDALDCLRCGSAEAEYDGSSDAGFYARDDGSGNHHVIGWSAAGAVALELDHEGADLERDVPESDRDPGRWLGGLVGLEAIRERVTGYGDRSATGGLWICGGEARRDGATPQLDPYLLDVGEALAAWSGVEGLADADRQLVQGLEAASRSGAHKLTNAEAQQLLERGDEAEPPTPRRAELAAKILAQVGVVWRGARSQATAAKQNAARSAAARLGALQVALLEAVHAGNLEATRSALDAGANPDCQSYRGQFEGAASSESPLIMAARSGNEAITLLLIERGAPLRGPGDQPLRAVLEWALLRGRARVVRELLAPGLTFPPDSERCGTSSKARERFGTSGARSSEAPPTSASASACCSMPG